MLRRYVIIGLCVLGAAFYLRKVYQDCIRRLADGQPLWVVAAGVLVFVSVLLLSVHLMRAVPSEQFHTTTGLRAAAGAVLAMTLAVLGGYAGTYVDGLLSLDNIAGGGVPFLGMALGLRAIAFMNSRFPVRSHTEISITTSSE